MLFGAPDWRGVMQDVSRAITTHLGGEQVLVTPATIPAPNFPAEPLHDKAAHAMAIFLAPYTTVDMRTGRRMDGGAVVSTREPRFEFEYRHGLPFEPRQGFWITRCNGERFEIVDVKPDSVARIVCTVTQLGRAGPLANDIAGLPRSTRTTDL
jgi:hypothetical protein